MSQVIKISLDDKGRILIPAALRSRLGLSPGMNLVVEDGDQDSVRLRVQSRPPVLVDKAGVLVVRAEPLSLHSTVPPVTRRVTASVTHGRLDITTQPPGGCAAPYQLSSTACPASEHYVVG